MSGIQRIDWAKSFMPVLSSIKSRFICEQPLKGMTIGMALHIEPKTANLAMTLAAGGAEVAITGCNPLSTQDDIAEVLRLSTAPEYSNIYCFARRGCSDSEYYDALDSVLDFQPDIVIDDGMDLIYRLHTERQDLLDSVIGGCEETTTGIHRLRAMSDSHMLHFPVFAVNDTPMKHCFDNVHGTGESALSAIMTTTNCLIAGKIVVIAGYGHCGRGLAQKASALGAKVIVTEVDPRKALEAHMMGYEVMPMIHAAELGDIFITTTGNTNIISYDEFGAMKSGVILANAGHFNVEIDRKALKNEADTCKSHDGIESFYKRGKCIHLLAEGRLVNLAVPKGTGHPIEVMDLSFAVQALCVEELAKNGKHLLKKLYDVPDRIDRQVAELKLETLDIAIDELTEEQRKYMSSWDVGT